MTNIICFKTLQKIQRQQYRISKIVLFGTGKHNNLYNLTAKAALFKLNIVLL